MITDDFRKGIVIKRIENHKFEVKDLYDGSIKISRLFGKSILGYHQIQIGMTIYIIQNHHPLTSKDWRMLTETNFKGDNYLWKLKTELDAFLSGKKNN